MKLLCIEMKGDDYRCLAEFAGSDTKSEALQDADEVRKMARVALDVEAIQLAPQEQIQGCTVEGIFKVPVSKAMEEIADVVGAESSRGGVFLRAWTSKLSTFP